MTGVLVPVKGVAVVGALGVAGGFAAGFAFAERIYATEQQKSAIRTGATIAALASVSAAIAVAIGVMRTAAS